MSIMNLSSVPYGNYYVTANGHGGFRSYYDDVYRSTDFTRIFVIKGGPGTGKSRLMQEVATAGERNGIAVYRLFCSSDPVSLDGVILERDGVRIAMMDGTAPHVRDSAVPGVIDETVDLAAFIDRAKILPERNEILSLMSEKQQLFSLAYRYLSLAEVAEGHAVSLLSRSIMQRKLDGAIMRILRQIPDTVHTESTVIENGIGMRGAVRFPNLEKAAKRLTVIGNTLGFSKIFFGSMLRSLAAAEKQYIRIEAASAKNTTEGIYFPAAQTLYISEDCTAMEKDDIKYLNASRFIDKETVKTVKSDIKNLLRIKNEAEENALAAFRSAGEKHFALENIYIAAMDFTAKEKLSGELIKRILALFAG